MGSAKGIPAMILDSAEEWIDETTLRGFQEVELPGAYAAGETIELLMPVLYSTNVYYQDETGVYCMGIRQAENRGILRIPFSVTVGGSTNVMTGTLHAQGYTADASITFSDVTAYGEVIFDAPVWAAACQAQADFWKTGREGEPPVMPDMITSYQLIAGEEVLANIGGGFGLNEEGKYHVLFEFDLPTDTSSLILRPEDNAFIGDEIPLKHTP